MLNATPVSSPFLPSTTSVGRVMLMVILTLVPGILVYIHFYGWGVLVNLVWASFSAVVFEISMLLLRSRPVRPFILDGSALLTAFLLTLALPPMVPWWIPVMGSFFAIVAAKHLYGGIGYNTFNPAMAAYAVLLISFPRELSLWASPLEQMPVSMSLTELLSYSLFHKLPPSLSIDVLTTASPLDLMRTETGLGKAVTEIQQAPVFGLLAGQGMEWVNTAFLCGGLWLLYRKIISWHIPVSMLISITVISGFFHLHAPDRYADPMFHLFGGASILGAFFIATDPVTAAGTPLGKLIYGAGIGIITFAIRTWGGYPDGIAFAVLLMGLTVPLLDQYTVPKVFGARSRHDPQ